MSGLGRVGKFLRDQGLLVPDLAWRLASTLQLLVGECWHVGVPGKSMRLQEVLDGSTTLCLVLFSLTILVRHKWPST